MQTVNFHAAAQRQMQERLSPQLCLYFTVLMQIKEEVLSEVKNGNSEEWDVLNFYSVFYFHLYKLQNYYPWKTS